MIPTVSVVTVTFKSERYIRGCLGSVAENGKSLALEHIVVDNGSKDGSADMIRGEFPTVQLIENSFNRGFTVANNQGAGVARGRYIVFLNPDTVVPAGALQTLLATMDAHPDIGVLAPRLVDEEGRWSLDMGHRAPTAWTVINSFLLLNRLSHDFFPGILRTKDVRGIEDCDWACGACLIVRRDVAEAFPWRDFGSGDDLDYCIQIGRGGWRVAVTGDAEVTHFAGRSWKVSKPSILRGTASHVARHLLERHGLLGAVVGIGGMRLGLWLRSIAHQVIYSVTRDPERLYKANKTRQFLAHDDYSVLRKADRPAPKSYPNC